MSLRPTERFSTRVENYVRYRPSYPEAVLRLLQTECGLNPSATVADIGSGTGISTAMLLRSGATVVAIEPNKEMRAAAEELLRGEANFRSVDASAEATTLLDHSVDLIVAGQAFHWFDHERARTEFKRILKPAGQVALMWNDRLTKGTKFLEGYEAILQRYSPDYKDVQHKNLSVEVLRGFFRQGAMKVAVFENSQFLDYPSLAGRVLSSSYAPEAGQPGHEEMMVALEQLFEETQEAGQVAFLYETQVYYGGL
ncbi:MAG: class I SAM-dependent methyltransferase [Fimbriimonas sp.]